MCVCVFRKFSSRKAKIRNRFAVPSTNDKKVKEDTQEQGINEQMGGEEKGEGRG